MENNDEFKVCKKCGLAKPIGYFCDFSSGMCRDCDRIRDRAAQAAAKQHGLSRNAWRHSEEYSLEYRMGVQSGIVHLMTEQHRAEYTSAMLVGDHSIQIKEPSFKPYNPNVSTTCLDQTEKITTCKSRGKFQRNWKGELVRSGQQCPFTGLNDPQFVNGSHIKGWNHCQTDFERVDLNNGILLAAHYDKLFDNYWITFSENGDLIISPLLPDAVKEAYQLPSSFNYQFNPERMKYMCFHRSMFYKINDKRK